MSAQHLPHELRHAQHKRFPHPTCEVCESKRSPMANDALHNDIVELLQFFTFEHLRDEKMREVSKSFADLAHELAVMTTEQLQAFRYPRFYEFVRAYDVSSPCNRQASMATTKLIRARAIIELGPSDPTPHGHVSHVLRILDKLIEAKDCAVRALLFKHAHELARQPA